jgi:hypothetical protein
VSIPTSLDTRAHRYRFVERQLYAGVDQIANTERLALFDDEPPAGRRLQRGPKLLAGEPAKELTDAVTMRRRHPRTADFTRLVSSQSAVICAMLVESQYDCHQAPPQAPWLITGTPRAPELRRPYTHARTEAQARLMPS